MNEPWFDPNAFAWIPGTAIGVCAGLWGGLAGWLAPRGKARRWVLGTGIVLVFVSALCLPVAVYAWFAGQPYGIWYGIGLPGVIGPIVLGANLPAVQLAYRRAEERRLAARDL
jgi:hypothetical protein